MYQVNIALPIIKQGILMDDTTERVVHTTNVLHEAVELLSDLRQSGWQADIFDTAKDDVMPI